MNIKHFKPNKLPKEEIQKYLNHINDVINKKVTESFCNHIGGCRKCPFYNFNYSVSFINQEICLTDYYKYSTKKMKDRFIYAYNYYIEHFVPKHKQEEMDV